MSKLFWIVGFGGFLGSIARYVAGLLIPRTSTETFPMSTFLVNIFGSLLIGLFYGISSKNNWLNPEWRLFLTTGFCGGFTTFSTFSYESLGLIESGNTTTALIYIVSSFVFGLLAAWLGYFISNFIG
jgi:fluoride exporter